MASWDWTGPKGWAVAVAVAVQCDALEAEEEQRSDEQYNLNRNVRTPTGRDKQMNDF